MRGTAVFSKCKKYRYSLTRSWALMGGKTTFIMLNPSIATETINDPTIRRCIGFAKREGCGSMEVVNIFAYRGKDPAVLYEVEDPVGPDNDGVILDACESARIVVAAWGEHGKLNGRGAAVASFLDECIPIVKCLGLTASGQPRHPLYVPADTPLMPLRLGLP